MKKFVFAILLTLLLLSATTLPALAASAYEDTAGHWAEAAIERWSGLEVILGFEGRFRPDDSITRGEMALILDRIFQYEEAADNPFADIIGDEWYAAAVLECAAKGVIRGYEGLARPLDVISRQEAAVMIARALGYGESGLDQALPYEDAGEVADWAGPVLSFFSAGGYITDSPIFFRPLAAITRAETVNLLNNLIAQLWRNSGLRNQDVYGNAVATGAKTMLLNSRVFGDLVICGGTAEKVILQNTEILGNIINPYGAEILYIEGLNAGSLFFGKTELPVQYNVPVNSWSGRDFYRDGKDRLAYTGAFRAGIDVSDWQKEIDWRAVSRDGIDFAILRCAYRGYSEGQLTADEQFYNNLAGALAEGLEVGVYVYSQAITEAEAREEARLALAMLNGQDLDLPIFFDWETAGVTTARTNGMDRETLTRLAEAFCQEIQQGGYEAGVYFYSRLAYDMYDLEQLQDYTLWLAGYFDTPEFYYDYDYWQYTSSGAVDGIEGRVDMNIIMEH